MATKFSFGGKTIEIPGFYGNIKSGLINPPVSVPYGDVLIIDTGSGAGYGGGAGVNGELSQDKNSIYEFDNYSDFQDFVGGGLWWLLANPLFKPAGLAANGASKIYFIKAATTTSATMNFEFFGDGHDSLSQSLASSVNGGTLTIKCIDEGLCGNGVKNGSVLTLGFGAKMTAGIIDTSKFILSFYRGTYKGLDQNSLPYDGVSDVNSTPELVAQSPEFDNISTLITWMQQDATFAKWFKLTASTVDGTGAIDSHDLIDYTDYNLASGGTESYADSTLLTRALNNVTDLLVNFVLADQYGANAYSTANQALVDFVVNSNKYNPELYVGGGDDANTYTSYSLNVAPEFDNDSVIVAHGAIYKNSLLGKRTYSSIYKAALAVGRKAGLAPQIPLTYKTLDIDGEVHQLNDQDVLKALDAGVLVSRFQNGSFQFVKGITSLQNNDFLLNDDGTTPSEQLKAIERQVNNTLIVNSQQLFANPRGTNRNTLSTNDLIAWAQRQLKALIALPDNDNLIISYQNVTVTRKQDGYFLEYEFVPNTEISFIFSTGVIIGI